MIQAHDFIGPAFERGHRFWTGVPCSFLAPLINCVIQEPGLAYVGAASEGEAVGIAFGAHLAGRKTVVLCQNSGLGNMVNPLTSLNYPFRVPTLLLVTHRGAPGLRDEPQHALMGEVTTDLLSTLRIPWAPFPERAGDVPAALETADRYMTTERLPYALVVRKGAVAPHALDGRPRVSAPPPAVPTGTFTGSAATWMSRRDAIALVAGLVCDDLVIATTGKIGRELFEAGHRPGQLYVVGGMGCASAIGLGVSLNQPGRRVVVLDGDGAALMKMGTLATIGHYAPANFVHVLLDNEVHESTGAQATVSLTVDFAQVASACAYRFAARCDTAADLAQAVRAAQQAGGPAMVHMKVGLGGSGDEVGRPTITPVDVKDQFIREALEATTSRV
jgi:phosphonopyruvate decarboxylase